MLLLLLLLLFPAASGTWGAGNLNFTAGGDVYVLTAQSGAQAATIEPNFDNTFTLTQTVGNIVVSSDITLLSAALVFRATAADADIVLERSTIATSSFSLEAMGDITSSSSTITAAFINLSAPMGSIGTPGNRIRVRSTHVIFTGFGSFLASANTTDGDVYVSTNFSPWLAYILSFSHNRLLGGGVLSATLEQPKPLEPGGFLSFVLDPILALIGSGCEKDDIFAQSVSGLGILCGAD